MTVKEIEPNGTFLFNGKKFRKGDEVMFSTHPVYECTSLETHHVMLFNESAEVEPFDLNK